MSDFLPGIALIGGGTVGRAVAAILSQRTDCQLIGLAVNNPHRERPGVPEDLPRTTDALALIQNPQTHLVVEVAGGIEPAKQWITEALKLGKPVVTANKDLMATYGDELRMLAEASNTPLLYEAAVAAGIPVVLPLKQSLAANQVQRVAGILNGTCNYILTRMAEDGWTYSHALQVAQDKGFAEADPTNDVGGKDTAYKLAILTRLAFQQSVAMGDIHCEGIEYLSDVDLELAQTLGFTVKLIGLAQRTQSPTGQEQLDLRVHPVMLQRNHPLASVANELNALWVEGNAVGELMFYGRGAGGNPTASGVCADVLSIVRTLSNKTSCDTNLFADPPLASTPLPLCPIAQTTSRYYIRLQTLDSVGVIGTIGNACGHAGVSLESIVQHGISPEGTATIVLVTHHQQEAQVDAALTEMTQSPAIEQVACKLRMLN